MAANPTIVATSSGGIGVKPISGPSGVKGSTKPTSTTASTATVSARLGRLSQRVAGGADHEDDERLRRQRLDEPAGVEELLGRRGTRTAARRR